MLFWKALNYGGKEGTQYKEVLEVLNDCNINGGPALQLGGGGNNNTDLPENQIDAKLEIEIAESLKKLNLKKAPRIPTMPEFYTVDNLINTKFDLTNIPVGISKTKLTPVTFNFDENYVRRR